MTSLSDAVEILKQAKATQKAEELSAKKPEPAKGTQQVVVKSDTIPPMYNMKSSDGKVVVKMMGEEPLKDGEEVIAE